MAHATPAWARTRAHDGRVLGMCNAPACIARAAMRALPDAAARRFAICGRAARAPAARAASLDPVTQRSSARAARARPHAHVGESQACGARRPRRSARECGGGNAAWQRGAARVWTPLYLLVICAEIRSAASCTVEIFSAPSCERPRGTRGWVGQGRCALGAAPGCANRLQPRAAGCWQRPAGCLHAEGRRAHLVQLDVELLLQRHHDLDLRGGGAGRQ